MIIQATSPDYVYVASNVLHIAHDTAHQLGLCIDRVYHGGPDGVQVSCHVSGAWGKKAARWTVDQRQEFINALADVDGSGW